MWNQTVKFSKIYNNHIEITHLKIINFGPEYIQLIISLKLSNIKSMFFSAEFYWLKINEKKESWKKKRKLIIDTNGTDDARSLLFFSK